MTLKQHRFLVVSFILSPEILDIQKNATVPNNAYVFPTQPTGVERDSRLKVCHCTFAKAISDIPIFLFAHQR